MITCGLCGGLGRHTVLRGSRPCGRCGGDGVIPDLNGDSCEGCDETNIECPMGEACAELARQKASKAMSNYKASDIISILVHFRDASDYGTNVVSILSGEDKADHLIGVLGGHTRAQYMALVAECAAHAKALKTRAEIAELALADAKERIGKLEQRVETMRADEKANIAGAVMSQNAKVFELLQEVDRLKEENTRLASRLASSELDVSNARVGREKERKKYQDLVNDIRGVLPEEEPF
jgi:hypothetical protein